MINEVPTGIAINLLFVLVDKVMVQGLFRNKNLEYVLQPDRWWSGYITVIVLGGMSSRRKSAVSVMVTLPGVAVF